MIGCPPFEAPDGARSPAADKPLDLILYALHLGEGVQVVRFDSTIVELRVAMTPPAFTCTAGDASDWKAAALLPMRLRHMPVPERLP